MYLLMSPLVAERVTSADKFKKQLDSFRDAVFVSNPELDRENLISTNGNRTPGTCEWIRQHSTCESWLRGESQLLWICGGPGQGKTFISIFLTQELERICSETGGRVLYFFCSSKSNKQDNAVAVLRCLTWQLLGLVQSSNQLDGISQYFKGPAITSSSCNDIEALWKMVESLVLTLKLERLFFLLDGVDECDNSSSRFLIAKFRQLLSGDIQATQNVRMIIVSRDIGLQNVPRIQIGSENNMQIKDDIIKFVNARISEISHVPGFDDDFGAMVKTQLINRAEGSFLWTGFVMNELAKKKTRTQIEAALADIPRELHQIYNRMLNQISDDVGDKIIPVLQWITVAFFPPSIKELAYIAGVEANVMKDLIIDCHPLLNEYDGTVTFVHQSARDHLLQPDNSSKTLEGFYASPEQQHLNLAERCLDIIEKNLLKELPIHPKKFIDRSLTREIPLLRYAILYWPDHARSSLNHADISKKLWHTSRPFFAPNSNIQTNWRKAYWKLHPQSYWKSWFEWRNALPSSPLHIASYFSIVAWVRFEIDLHEEKRRYGTFLGLDLSAPWSRRLVNTAGEEKPGDMPLTLATIRGNEEVVQLLIDKGADVNAQGGLEEQAIVHAARNGYESIVRLLLRSGAKVDGIGSIITLLNSPRSALDAAISSGHESIVRLLLHHGADINFGSLGEETPLTRAIGGNNSTMVELLLDKGADIDMANIRGIHRNTPLVEAVRMEHDQIAQLLLDRGADVNKQGTIGWRSGYSAIFTYKDTALLCAAGSGNTDMAKKLINSGADLEIRNVLGFNQWNPFVEEKSSTPLIYAAKQTFLHMPMIKLLLEHGADVNAQDEKLRSPLILAVHRYQKADQEATVRLLLEHGADESLQDDSGKTAMDYASNAGDQNIRVLLEAGAATRYMVRAKNASSS